jgi:hypothetical protein
VSEVLAVVQECPGRQDDIADVQVLGLASSLVVEIRR